MIVHDLSRVMRFFLTATAFVALVATMPKCLLDKLRHVAPTRDNSTTAREEPTASCSSAGVDREAAAASSRAPRSPSLDLNQYLISFDGIEAIENEPPGYRERPDEEMDFDGFDDLAFDLGMEKRFIDEMSRDENGEAATVAPDNNLTTGARGGRGVDNKAPTRGT
jgi:hypothetical protein